MPAEVKAMLRKLDFPAVVVEALAHLQKTLATPLNPMLVDTSNEILEEFVFLERRRKKLSAVRELHLLDVMCTCYQTMSQEAGRNVFFVMFPPTDRIVLERRISILSRLVSLAVTLNVDILLDCAAFWMHVAGISNEVPLQLTRQLLRELFDGSGETISPDDTNGPDPQAPPLSPVPPTALQMIHTSPAFCATFMTVVTVLYPWSPPPRRLLCVLSAWLESNLHLAFVPLESIIPTALTFVPGLMAWTTLAGLSSESAGTEVASDLSAEPLDLSDDLDRALVNRLHLALLKIILKAPPATLQADHLIKLAHSLQSKLSTDGTTDERATAWRIERFLQVVQASLSSCCIQGSLRGLKATLVRLPPIQLTAIVLEINKTALLS